MYAGAHILICNVIGCGIIYAYTHLILTSVMCPERLCTSRQTWDAVLPRPGYSPRNKYRHRMQPTWMAWPLPHSWSPQRRTLRSGCRQLVDLGNGAAWFIPPSKSVTNIQMSLLPSQAESYGTPNEQFN